MPWQDPIVARLAADEAESCRIVPPLFSFSFGHGWWLHEVRPRDARVGVSGRSCRAGNDAADACAGRIRSARKSITASDRWVVLWNLE